MFEFDILRVLLAFFCGYFLCLSGTLTQLISNNPLASPSTLGMDGIGVLFVIIGQLLLNFFGVSSDLADVSLRLFLIFFLLIALFPKRSSTDVWNLLSMKSFIIVGLAFNLFIGAIFTIIQFMFVAFNYDFPTGLWFGSLKIYNEVGVWVFLVLFIISKLFVVKYGRALQFLNLGRSYAYSLGQNVKQVQLYSLLLALLITGVVISYFGVFSFLGLILPHILRNFSYFKVDMYKEILIGPYCSGIVLVILDQACFYFPINGAELPVGMVSSILGAMTLIILLVKSGFNRV